MKHEKKTTKKNEDYNQIQFCFYYKNQFHKNYHQGRSCHKKYYYLMGF